MNPGTTMPIVLPVQRHKFQARCQAKNCRWTSPVRDSRAEASADGKRHRWDGHLSGLVAR